MLGNPTPALAYKKVNWVSLNPNLKGAQSINTLSKCKECHAEYIRSFARTKHAQAFRAKFGKTGGIPCEKCHGPMGKHLGEKSIAKKRSKTVSFKTISPKAKNHICLQCHQKGPRMHWRGSQHELSGVSCSNCHYVMKKKSRRKLLIHEDPKATCFQCHRAQQARLTRTSHMPLREGKMDCTSCHNPHGGPGPSLLKLATVNETCGNCHQEKRGPLLWEHAPVRENCIHCHDPHGSSFLRMLKRKVPYLCQQCHMNIAHSSFLRDGRDLTAGSFDSNFVRGKSCLNCHSKIHGSNHPSGARFER